MSNICCLPQFPETLTFSDEKQSTKSRNPGWKTYASELKELWKIGNITKPREAEIFSAYYYNVFSENFGTKNVSAGNQY